jgi:thioredoxin reductase
VSGLSITVVGASDLGCRFALMAHAAGHKVTLIDEHPQTMAQMSLDAPWFYGAALPAALANESAIAVSVLEGAPQLAACFEAGIEVRVSTVAWGAFQNGPNSQHVGTPKVGLVDATGNALLDHDVLVLATGARDFVASFQGSDLPGVFGVKAGMALLDLYQCYEPRRTLVLGTSDVAVDFVRRARRRGVQIVGMVEPGDAFAAGPDAEAEIAGMGIPVHLASIIPAAEGKGAVTSARLGPVAGTADRSVDCDSVCLAIGVLPNIELPAAMGCHLRLDSGLGAWMPEVDAAGRTTVPDVYWLSSFAGTDPQITLEALSGHAPAGAVPPCASTQGAYLRAWIAALRTSGGDAVTLCKCETISRGEFLGLRPPSYLHGAMRQPKSPMTGTAPGQILQQDLAKRMTRVGMGHCQGKRCRDEAAILLSQHFGVAPGDIRPGSYRFPVRPINLEQIGVEDAPAIRDRWSYWLHPSPTLPE